MKEPGILSRLFTWILKKLHVIYEVETSKEEMCRRARKFCDKNCEWCVWKDGVQ